MQIDPDAELTAWHEWQGPGLLSELPRHRCPMDMPPCPECEARIEEEDYREFGNQ